MTNFKAPLFDWNSQKWEGKNKRMYESAGANIWPWFYEALDPDIDEALTSNAFASGCALDIGTCSGHQAIGLAKRGFEVVATEVSETALVDARKNIAALASDQSVTLVIDDIADSQLESNKFDVIFDRGCFHSICLFAAEEYAHQLKRLSKPSSIIFIKTMSIDEDRFVQYDTIGDKELPMPYRFEKAELEKFFNRHFSQCEVTPSVFYSDTISRPAKAWLTTIHNKSV